MLRRQILAPGTVASLPRVVIQIFFFFKWGVCFIFFKDFIYLFDREKSQVVGEAGRERERD